MAKIKKQTEDNDLTESFSAEEQRKIVEMICQDITADENVQQSYIERRKKSLQQKNCEKPSIIECLNIRKWQSDVNLGVAPAVADTYQSPFLS